jgi:excisionase family DNA binding protein
MGNEPAPNEKLLTKCEVAQLCRVEIRTVDRWVTAGKLRCYRTPSGRLLFRKSDVLMAANGRSADAPSGDVSSSDPTDPALRR